MIDFEKLRKNVEDRNGFCHWDPPHKPLQGFLTCCYTEETKEVTVHYFLRGRDNGRQMVLYLVGGPTSYESFILEDRFQYRVLCAHGWTACAGTRNRYDTLKIPGKEMRRLFAEEGIYQFDPAYWDENITVCAECLCAGCWQGVWYCEKFKDANVVHMTRRELSVLGREAPSFWKTDQELANG